MGRDLDPEVAGAVGTGVLGRAAVEALDGHRLAAAGDAHPLQHLGDHPDRGELAIGPRHEQDPVLLAEVEGEGRGHAREDQDVVEGDEQQGFHLGLFHRL